MAYNTSSLRRVLQWRIPIYIYLITVIVFLFFIISSYKNEAQTQSATNYLSLIANSTSKVDLIRIKSDHLASPLLMTYSNSEPIELLPLKASLYNIISADIASGKIDNASVYLRKLDFVGSISINPNEEYNPGSMMKIPVMIACLKEGMNNPLFLTNKVTFEGHNASLPIEEGTTPVLIPGKTYTIKELIEFMIIDSDNDAMGLLYFKLGQDKLDKVFTDFGITIPDRKASAFNMNPAFFSRFMNILYNATYLDLKNSDWALTTLSKAKYNKGLIRNLPHDLKIAHKYGVEFDGTYKMLSESAIVYSIGQPYLLVVMTKGKDYGKQSDVISEISDNAYEFFKNVQ